VLRAYTHVLYVHSAPADWPDQLLTYDKAGVVFSSQADSSRPGQLLFRGLRVRVAISTGGHLGPCTPHTHRMPCWCGLQGQHCCIAAQTGSHSRCYSLPSFRLKRTRDDTIMHLAMSAGACMDQAHLANALVRSSLGCLTSVLPSVLRDLRKAFGLALPCLALAISWMVTVVLGACRHTVSCVRA